jgi:hypothetical protein
MELSARNTLFSSSGKRLWAGRVMTILAVLFLLFDSIGKIIKVRPVVEGTIRLGYSEDVLPAIGIVLLVCTIIFVVPRTSVLGAIPLTGYLGGAVATHVRIASPLFSHVLFPIYVSCFIWGGLYLRENRLHTLIPINARLCPAGTGAREIIQGQTAN